MCVLERFKLICCAQFEPLWNYLKVWSAQRSLFLYDVGYRMGSKFLIHTILTMMGGLVPQSWAMRWPTSGALCPPTTPSFSLTGVLPSIHLAPYIVDRIMKKYDKAPSRIWQARHGGVPGVPAQMDQDHFVFVCAVVRRICDLYEEYIAGGQTRLSRDDFLRATIPLP
jgi:hypothetical protein